MPLPESLERLISRSLDAPLTRAAFERFDSEITDRLMENEPLATRSVAVFAASRSLALAVTRDPKSLDSIDDATYPVAFSQPTTQDSLAKQQTLAITRCGDPLQAIRRFKHSELLRIAARDLTRTAPLETIAAELSLLGSFCLTWALEIARAQTQVLDLPFAIFGMGKLGGGELNYSSDVDVVFVHEGDLDLAQKLARQIIRTMQDPTADGIVFRTDADLRPEGRAGALSRTVEGYQAYYERWAEAWEYQALLKADFSGGSVALGKAFSELIGSVLWSAPLPNEALRTLRHMKSRSEQQTSAKGQTSSDVKRGAGGIRDIEFSIQLLQLVHGRADATLRSPNSLTALEALRDGRYLTHADASTFREAYVFLRETEHRIQLVDEAQTHLIPEDAAARSHLARALGFSDHGVETAVTQFERAHARIRSNVRSAHERAFFAPLLDAIMGNRSDAAASAPRDATSSDDRLAAFGFTDTDATAAAIRELAPGISRTSAVMRQYLPLLLEWLSQSPDPNRGLLGLRRLLDGPARTATVISAFRESPLAAERTCLLLGSSRLVRDALRRHPEVVRTLADDDLLNESFTQNNLLAEARSSIEWRGDREAQQNGLRRFKRRKLLDIAIRDLVGRQHTRAVGSEISALADACLGAACTSDASPLVVIAMGRLGGSELSYGSDLDVMFTYSGSGHQRFEAAEKAATRLMRDIGTATTEGETFRIDADLRPEGKKGLLALSLDGYRDYYASRAEPWEILALLKARVVSGDPEAGCAVTEMADAIRYQPNISDQMVKEIRRIKLRVENERLPRGADPELHLKLGRGSISDIEFTVQLLQLRFASAMPTLRTQSTHQALHAIREESLMPESEVDAFANAFTLCEQIRNAVMLTVGTPSDQFPTGDERAVVAQICGFDNGQDLLEEYRKRTRKSRQLMERYFFEMCPS